MSGGAKKSAPREKEVIFGEQQYRVTHSVHYINGSIVPIGGLVYLPKGVKPGKSLVPVDEDGNDIKAKAAPAEPAKPDSSSK